jgi:alkanesulfonate monooxygenase SsuD/methylene tetrahydromethanopterin reductase-like flavin-dependent oxidoreductase (luciferase family)
MGKNIRFGVIAVQNASWGTLVNRWRYIEQKGYDTLWVADHFTVPFKSYYDMPWFEAWTVLSGLATLTSKIRIGTLVTAIPWRNPAWLARQALTIDHISNGRLELGIGSGGHGDIGHSMTGIEDWKPGERVRRFREYIEILDLLLREPVTTYEGKYYRLKEAHMQPQSIQKPRPPITIGAYRPLMLKHTARYADAWNRIGGITEDYLKEVKHQNKLLDKYCIEIGRNPDTLRRSYVLCEHSAMRNLGPMHIYESIDCFTEGVDKCFDVGISEFIISYPNIDEQVPIFKKISKDIIPELRKKYTQ